MRDVFFFNDTATTEIYTLSLHDALPIFPVLLLLTGPLVVGDVETRALEDKTRPAGDLRSEEHTSELQSQSNLVCRLLLEQRNLIQLGVLAFLLLRLVYKSRQHTPIVESA